MALNEQDKQRILDMISGKTEPPNDAVKYLVDKVQKIRKEREQISKDIEILSKQATALNDRMNDLGAQSNGYIEDILHFEGKTSDKKPA